MYPLKFAGEIREKSRNIQIYFEIDMKSIKNVRIYFNLLFSFE